MEIRNNLNSYAISSKNNKVRFHGTVNAMSKDVICKVHTDLDILKLLYRLKTGTPAGVRNDLCATPDGNIIILPVERAKKAGKAGYFNPLDDINKITEDIFDYLRQFNLPGIPEKRNYLR